MYTQQAPSSIARRWSPPTAAAAVPVVMPAAGPVRPAAAGAPIAKTAATALCQSRQCTHAHRPGPQAGRLSKRASNVTPGGSTPGGPQTENSGSAAWPLRPQAAMVSSKNCRTPKRGKAARQRKMYTHQAPSSIARRWPPPASAEAVPVVKSAAGPVGPAAAGAPGATHTAATYCRNQKCYHIRRPGSQASCPSKGPSMGSTLQHARRHCNIRVTR